MLVDLARRADLLDAPAVHDCNAVGHRQRLFLVVRDVDEGRAELVLDPLQLQLHLLAQLHVQRSERLVEEQRCGPVDERTGERDALLLAAGKLARSPALHPLQGDDSQQVVHTVVVLRLRHALDLEPEGDVVVDGHVRKQGVLLEDHVHRAAVRGHGRDVAPLEHDAALVGHLEAGDHAQRRRLPAAARSEQGEELALADRERDALDGSDPAEALADVLERDRDPSVSGHGASLNGLGRQ